MPYASRLGASSSAITIRGTGVSFRDGHASTGTDIGLDRHTPVAGLTQAPFPVPVHGIPCLPRRPAPRERETPPLSPQRVAPSWSLGPALALGRGMNGSTATTLEAN